MAFAYVVPLVEAAAFTLGAVVIGMRRFDPDRISALLTIVAAALGLVLLLAATPPNTSDTLGLDPDEVHSILE